MKTNDDFIEEDWEREVEKDKMFLCEKVYRAEEEEFQRWIEEQDEKTRKPAEIKVKKYNQKEDEEFVRKYMGKEKQK
jgi:hypothetical protein